LTPLERRWAVDLLRAFAPETTGEGLVPLPGEVDYLATFDRMRARATRLAALGLRAAVWLIALTPLWQRGRFATMSALPVQARAEKLAELLAHRLFIVRELALLLKLCAAMALFASPSVRARSAYDDVHDAPANQSGLRRKPAALVVLQDHAQDNAKSRRTSA
jgi:hypothetical protein